MRRDFANTDPQIGDLSPATNGATQESEQPSRKPVIFAVIDGGGGSMKAVFQPAEGSLSKADRKLLKTKDGKNLLKKIKKDCGLAKEIHQTGKMSDESMDCAMSVLEDANERITELEELGFDVRVKAVGTAPFRTALNSKEFQARIEKAIESDLPKLKKIKILSETEEAKMAAKGFLSKYPGASAIVVDMGGGSTEFIVIRQGKIKATHSLPHGYHDIKRATYRKDAFLQTMLAELPAEFRNTDLSFFVSGGVNRTISKAMAKAHDLDITSAKPCEISTEQTLTYMHNVAADLIRAAKPRRPALAEKFNIKEERVDYLKPALWLMAQMQSDLGAKMIALGNASLRDALFAKMQKDFDKETIELAQKAEKEASQSSDKTPKLDGLKLPEAA